MVKSSVLWNVLIPAQLDSSLSKQAAPGLHLQLGTPDFGGRDSHLCVGEFHGSSTAPLHILDISNIFAQ